ncbi:MAG: T9SS type A sorting domain-containing protein [Bacteroidota bacterium]
MKTTLLCIAHLLTYSLLLGQTVTTITEGAFSDGLAIDDQGNLYGSDFGGDSVYKYDINGDVTVFKNGFVSPNGIALDPQGNIYICDHFGNTLYKYDSEGVELATFSEVITPAGIQNIPGTNDMIIVGYSSNTVNILDNDDGSITELVSEGLLNGPAGIAFVNDQIFIANFLDRKVLRLDGQTLVEIAQLPAGASQTNFLGFLTSFGGQLYATQIGEGKIYRIDPVSGDFEVFAGSVTGNNDGPLETATFNRPNGILGDEANNRIYVSDAGSKNLRIIEGISLGLENREDPSLGVVLTPNPGRDEVRLISDETIIEVWVYNALMKKLTEIKGDNLTHMVTNGWSTGAYWVKMITEEGKSITKKILIH